MPTLSSCRTTLAAAAVSALVLTTAGRAAAEPEGDPSKGPEDNAGYFLGYPTPTYSWHGCTATSSRATPETLPEGVPGTGKGTKQSKVTWTTEASTSASSRYVVTWKVADGWRICGVQVAVRGTNPDAPNDLAMEAGYTSKATKGSTVVSGGETIKVKVSKDDVEMLGLDQAYGNKSYAIGDIYGITVFIKKKK